MCAGQRQDLELTILLISISHQAYTNNLTIMVTPQIYVIGIMYINQGQSSFPITIMASAFVGY